MSTKWENDDNDGLGGLDTIIEDRVGEDTDIREPKMYKVIMLNDDYTPFDFVSAILQTVFKHTAEAANMIAKEVHDKGKAIAGTFTHDIAETKSYMVNKSAEESKFPFKTVIESE